MSQPLSDTELDELRADYGKPWSTTSWNGLRWQKALATIDALRTQLAEQREYSAAKTEAHIEALDWRDERLGNLEDGLAAAEAREAKLREALERLTYGPPEKENIPGETNYTYQLWGDYAEDARYVYPARERWFKDQARAALAPESLEVQG